MTAQLYIKRRLCGGNRAGYSFAFVLILTVLLYHLSTSNKRKLSTNTLSTTLNRQTNATSAADEPRKPSKTKTSTKPTSFVDYTQTAQNVVNLAGAFNRMVVEDKTSDENPDQLTLDASGLAQDNSSSANTSDSVASHPQSATLGVRNATAPVQFTANPNATVEPAVLADIERNHRMARQRQIRLAAAQKAALSRSPFVDQYVTGLTVRRVTDVPPVRNLSSRLPPVRSFVFHALHKTGSTRVRNQLRAFCHLEQLTCLTYCACGVCRSHVQCHQTAARELNDSHVDFGSLTVARMKHKCCRHFDRLSEHLDGVVEHFPLNDRDNQAFLVRTVQPDAFRFTFVRDPLEQFVSYHATLYNARYQTLNVPDLEDTVLRLHAFRTEKADVQSRTSSLEHEKYAKLYDILTNSQSKELGWDGRTVTSLNKTIAYVKTLDFVGLTENVTGSYHALRHLLRWNPGVYFARNWKLQIPVKLKQDIGNADYDTVTRKSRVELDGLAEDVLHKLTELQWADRRVFEAGRRRFQQVLAEVKRARFAR